MPFLFDKRKMIQENPWDQGFVLCASVRLPRNMHSYCSFHNATPWNLKTDTWPKVIITSIP